MDRRRFLTTSTAGAAILGLGASNEGCGGWLRFETVSLRDPRIRELIARLQRGTRRIREEPFGSMVRDRPSEARPDLVEHVMRLTLESLVVLDAIRSLPDDVPDPSVLSEAFAPAMQTLDRCTHTHHALLRRMPDDRRRDFDRIGREQPDLVMDIAQWVDGQASELGVPLDNRTRLRAAAMSVGARIRRQSASAVIDDSVTRLSDAMERHGMQLRPDLAANTDAVVDAIWQVGSNRRAPERTLLAKPTGESESSALATNSAGHIDPYLVPARFGSPGEMENPTEPVQWSTQWASPGDHNIRAGAIMMPLGLASCGLLLIVGLITLIVGEVQNANWNGRTTSAQ